MSEKHIKTLKFRVKDKHAPDLLKQSREVNLVWNYVNELSHRHTKKTGKFFSAFDLNKYTTGLSKEGISLHSQSVQAINEELVTRRKQFKKTKLRWRKSKGTGRSLGWVPIKTSAIKYKNGQVHYQNKHISLWDSYGLSKYHIRTGSFSEDSRGRWYLNVTVQFETVKSQGTGSVGIDLGCKSAAVTSNGDRLEGRNYRLLEEKLGKAQRAKKKNRVRAIHAKIKNKRKDQLHKFTTNLVKQNAAIFVGDVSSKKLVKTKLAKSVLDASWGQLKSMLEYKCHWADVEFKEIDEAYTTQTCSYCGCISTSSPRGRTGLGIREWTCDDCGISHDRDINSAKNILVAGHRHLEVGIPCL